MTWLFLSLSLLLLVPFALALSRANELFVVEIRNGRARLARGRIPQRLLGDLREVVQGVPRGTLRCVSESGRPMLYARGEVGAAERQRLRNLVGMWTVPQIRAGARSGR